MKDLAKRTLRHFGLELIRKRPHAEDLVIDHRVDVVLDVGANDGLYGRYLRAAGYGGRIVSFEPVRSTFDALHNQAASDPQWETVNLGLGREDTVATINVARRSVFSSILQPLATLKEFASDDVASVGEEKLSLKTLDSQFPLFVRTGERVFLKIDTQGYEREVILGGQASLTMIWGIQLELSLKPLYQGEASIAEMIALLERNGFHLALIDPVTFDQRSGVLLQIDCVFLRDDVKAGSNGT